MAKVAGEEIPTGTAVEAVNTPADAPTTFIDAVQGIMVSQEVGRVSFIQHVLTDEGLKGKFVHTIVMPHSQIRAIGELLIAVAEDQTESKDG